VIIARDPGDAAAVAGMQLGLGYLMAASSPLLLGLLRDSTGSFDSGLWLVVGTAALVVACVVALVLLLRRREA
jgi:cyanate permease